MSRAMRRFLGLGAGSLAIALMGGVVIAQQPAPESQPVPPLPSATPGESRVSEPEAAPNPVKERADQSGRDTSSGADQGTGGIDPELGPIAEPDDGDVGPALRMSGDGEWKRPDDDVRRRIREEAMQRAEDLQRKMDAAGAGQMAGDGLQMPRLMAPNIPNVPLELLFPPEMQANGPPPVRESPGTMVEIGALDRDSGKTAQIRIPVGSTGTFGAISVKVEGCFMSHPEDRTEAWAFVNVVDRGRTQTRQLAVLPQRDRRRMKEAQGERSIRKGWIIASSPVVTPIDHPTYDVWLTKCEGNGGAPPPPQWPGGIAPPTTPAGLPANGAPQGAALGGPTPAQGAAQGPVQGAVPAPAPAPQAPQPEAIAPGKQTAN